MKYDKTSPDPMTGQPRSGDMKRHRLAAVESETDDFGYQESSGNLSRIFTILLLLHVFLIGAVVLYNIIVKKPDAMVQEPQVAPNAMAAIRESENEQQIPRSQQSVESQPASIPTVEYIVRPGQNLQSIAEITGTTSEMLIKLNNLHENGALYVGRKLRVPAPADGVNHTPMVVQNETQPKEAELAKSDMEMTKVPSAIPIPKTTDNPPAAQSQNPVAGNGTALNKETKTTVSEPKAKPTIEQAAQKRPEVAASDKSKKSSESRTYAVRSGDTFYAIARKHNVDVKELMKINGYTDASKLRIGAVLKLP